MVSSMSASMLSVEIISSFNCTHFALTSASFHKRLSKTTSMVFFLVLTFTLWWPLIADNCRSSDSALCISSNWKNKLYQTANEKKKLYQFNKLGGNLVSHESYKILLNPKSWIFFRQFLTFI